MTSELTVMEISLEKKEEIKNRLRDQPRSAIRAKKVRVNESKVRESGPGYKGRLRESQINGTVREKV